MVSICDLKRVFLEPTYAVLKKFLYLEILNLLFFLTIAELSGLPLQINSWDVKIKLLYLYENAKLLEQTSRPLFGSSGFTRAYLYTPKR